MKIRLNFQENRTRLEKWITGHSFRKTFYILHILYIVFHPLDFSSELGKNNISAYYSSLQRFWTSRLVKLQPSVTPTSTTKTLQLFKHMGNLVYYKERSFFHFQ